MASLARKLWHYERAVQQPVATVTLIERVYTRLFGQTPTRLREDFAGTAAVAAAWVRLSDEHRALAVERDEATARWAAERIDADLGERAVDAPVVAADVMDLVGPRVDAVAALNFSLGEWHDRASLVRYLRHARRCLDRRGVLVADLYGGRGAWVAPRRQRRWVTPDDGGAFEYVWEQRTADAVRSRVRCAIHFEPEKGRVMERAFAYDWRLWGVAELREAMREAGFAETAVWSSRGDNAADDADDADGVGPVDRLHGGGDWVAYVVGVKRPRS
jgi:hypothetical protein